MRNSIRSRLTVAFIGLAIGPLLLTSLILAWQSFTDQQQQALNLQAEVVQRVSTQVNAFIRELENDLNAIIEIRGLPELDRDQQKELLSQLQSHQTAIEALALLDSKGQEQIRLSRVNIVTDAQLGDRSNANEFVIPKESDEIYFSTVQIDQTTGEPLMTISVPLHNPRSGLVEGILVADIRFKPIWDLIASIQVSEGERIYIVDSQGRIVAHRNPSLVLKGTQLDLPDQNGIHSGLAGSRVVLAVNKIQLGDQTFRVVAEKDWAEALALAINTLLVIAFIIIIALLLASGLVFLAVRQIIQPIEKLAVTAKTIAAGDLTQQVEITSRDELGTLANSFNTMTAQLNELIERQQSRIGSMEISADISRQLTTILDVEELLQHMLSSIQNTFGYYHAHIYLLDDARNKLVVAEGTGPAGAEMKANQHSIALDAPVSLVAQAARSGEVVSVDNVRETADWLPNPLLPDTYSEMAIPIMLEGQVVGVLDVQENEVAGFDEGGATLLRSMANQAAIGIRNARLFDEVETALAEARESQARYLGEAWTKTEVAREYLYKGPDVAKLPEVRQQIIEQIRQEAQTQDGLQILDFNSDDGQVNSLVAPIKLRNMTLGSLQLHSSADNREWTEDDVAIIETVIDQMAQTAENLRLFDETQERASSEQATREVTDKLRASTDLNTLLETAAHEICTRLDIPYAFLELGLNTTAQMVDSEPKHRPDSN